MDSSELGQAIEADIRGAVGSRFCADPREVQALRAGGTGKLSSGQAQVFCKLVSTSESDRLDAEADGLAAIAATDTFHSPAVIARGEAADFAWLVLEWLDLRPLSEKGSAQRAAELLAEMHSQKHAGRQYGWHRDNYIGATPQDNTPGDNWSRFFALERLRPQFERAAANGHRGDLQKDGQRVVERLPALFLDQRPRPSLLHGDLWHGNIGALADGAPVIFDPACYHGDREADIAMSELFGGLPHAFYAGYRRQLPLSADYETRKQLYNLYHILNHLNLFGRGYLSQACRMASQLRQALGR